MNTKELREFRDRVRRFRRALGGHLEENCCGYDVTLAQCDVLLEAGRSAHTTAVELARALHLDTSTLSRTIEALVERGLLRRDPDHDDRRYNRLALTPEGRKRCEELDGMGDENARRLLGRIEPEKRALAVEGFCLIAEALERDCSMQEGGCHDDQTLEG